MPDSKSNDLSFTEATRLVPYPLLIGGGWGLALPHPNDPDMLRANKLLCVHDGQYRLLSRGMSCEKRGGFAYFSAASPKLAEEEKERAVQWSKGEARERVRKLAGL